MRRIYNLRIISSSRLRIQSQDRENEYRIFNNTIIIPAIVACTFPFSISRYRGLSGNHGNSISWTIVGNTTRERSRGQCSS